MKLTRISTDHYNGQSPCKRCGFVNWACMMVEFKEIKGHYCYKCAEEVEKEYRKV
jgi:hypothetical protein